MDDLIEKADFKRYLSDIKVNPLFFEDFPLFSKMYFPGFSF